MTAKRQAVVYYPHTLEIGNPARWIDVHDWVWRDGRLKYYSRVIDGRVWLLLEYGP